MMDLNVRIALLRASLAVCPTDIVARCQLALLLEESDKLEDAFCNWKTILGTDPNNLQAREGMARCRGGSGPK